tara:strand:- start:300 stop:554 length:255 start_codon:yes stop_codon:yes gene_type:complete
MNSSEKNNSFNKDNEKVINQIKEEDSNLRNEVNQETLEDNKYVFGWGQYSEITNGRFAMIGFIAILLIEIISKKAFLNWAGIIH